MSQEQDYFAELPDEMVLSILDWLDFESMQAARECCVRFDALLTPRFEDSSLLTLDRWKQFKLARDNAEHNWVFQSNKKFKNVCFREYNFDEASNSDIEEFWNLHGANIIYLHFSYCTMAEETLYSILDKVINLKTFKLGLSKDIDGATIINKLYDRCEEITFTSTTIIDKNAITLISADRHSTIKELNLEYVRDSGRSSSFQDGGIYQLLKRLQPKLKRFELFATNGGDNCVQHIARLNLDLTKFKVYFHDELDNSHMLTLTSQMRNLQKLDIQGTVFSDENANIIYDNLHELRSLTFRECDLLGNKGIVNVTKLKKLEEFTVNTCQNVTNAGIVNGIGSKENHILKRLHLYERFSDDTLISIVNNLPELEALSILSILFISPHLITLIYERLTNLKEITINSLNSPEDADMFQPDEVAKKLPEPKLQNANVKISALKNLMVLEIYGCGSIPGATMADIAELPKLRNLTLHNYETISKDEMIHLLTKLTSLRIVDLRYCNDFLENEEDRADIQKAKRPKTKFQFNFETL